MSTITTSQTFVPVDTGERAGRRRWFICSQLALIIMMNYLDRGNIGVVLPVIQRDFGLDNAQVGLVMSSFQWVYALSNIAMGFAVDVIGPRWLIVVAAFGWTVCAASTGLATGLAGLVVSRGFLGLMESPMFPAGIKIVTTWFPDREKAVAISLYEIATSAGNLLAPLLAAYLTQLFGWRVMFIGVAALTLPLLCFWAFFYRAPDADPKLGDAERTLIRSGRSSSHASTRPTVPQWFGLFRHHQTWVMIAGGMCLSGVYSFLLWLPNYLEIERHFTLIQAGKMLSGLGTFHILGVMAGSIFSDRLVRNGVSVLRARTLTLSSAALSGGIVLSLVVFASTTSSLFATVAASYFLLGLGVTSWWALVPVVAPRPELVASLGSLQNGGMFLGMALSPLINGWLLDQGYGYHPLIIASAAFGLGSALLYGVALRHPAGSGSMISTHESN